MNVLGHLLLSGSDEYHIVGNYIGDHVKGNAYQKFPTAIQEGILLHRRIDSYTDTHSSTREVRQLLFDSYRHFSGVLVDIIFDHFLALHWTSYSSENLQYFSDKSLGILRKHEQWLVGDALLFLHYLQKYNRLVGYRELDQIDKVLMGMSKKYPLVKEIDKAGILLRQHYAQIEQCFRVFMKDIVIEIVGQDS